MSATTRFNLAYLAIALLGIVSLHEAWVRTQSVALLPYSEFQSLLDQGQVKEVVIEQHRIRGELAEPREGRTRFVTTRVEPALAGRLDELGVTYSGAVESQWLPTLLSWVIPVLLFFGIWALIARRLSASGPGSGLMSIGKSKAKIYVEQRTGVSFADVAGIDESKQELQEVVSFLQNPSDYGRLGARMPKGVLLVGPPGTGKTLLARAVAGEARVPFFSISGSEFVEMFVGVGAARVRDLFEQARQQAPCIIFIDELDALGKARQSNAGFAGHDEKEQTLNQLLVELDGFDPASGIVLLAATNRPEILDPALLRAGRFDRQVLVDRPDRSGRVAILEVHASKVQVAPDLDLEAVASLTPGFSGADLANLVNEAALSATRRQAEHVTLADFNAAVERIVAGLERRNRLLNPRERAIVAHHEMGHALVAAALPAADPVHKVSIIPRGLGALGYTMQRPTGDRFLMTREELEARMAVLLGGRAAELIVFGDLSTGAADDLSRATDIARNMVTRYGMVPALGPVAFEHDRPTLLGQMAPVGQPLYGAAVADRIDTAIRDLVQHALNRAVALLTANRELLLASSADLLAKETLEGETLDRHLGRVRKGEHSPPEVRIAVPA